MTQPTRRRSSLTGASPVAPPERGPEPTPEAPQGERPAEQPARPRRASQSKHKLSIYQDPDDTARLRAAYRHTLAASTDRSFSDFINRVLMAEVERLEAQHNGGQPFRGVGAGEIPTGRPVGE
ncbi:MAG: hypothetical protein L0H26_00265 [Microlunatus sp.]|nr:hypothetical protein [Microlunatus sp.]